MQMKKFFRLFFILAPAFALVACGEDYDGPITPDPGCPGYEEEPVEKIIDLSAPGMANCYIVSAPGKYIFKADNRFNLGEGLPVPPEINPVSAALVWQSVPGSIAWVELTDEEGEPYVSLEVAEAQGNAVIAVLDEEEVVQWSWHIWMPQEEVTSVHLLNGYDVMNMNLGAMNNTSGDPLSYGMLYQWGRKDPFPAAATLTGDTNTLSAPMYDIDGNPVLLTHSSWTSLENNILEYAIANPTEVLSNMAQFSSNRDWLAADKSDNALWGNPNGDDRDPVSNAFINKGRKTCYDPSPAGWRVAPPDAFSYFTLSSGYAWNFDDFMVIDFNNDGIINLEDYNYGWHFIANNTRSLYFPAAARFDGSYAMLMGSVSGIWGSYWSNSPYSSVNGGAFCGLSFQVQDMYGNEMVTISPSGGASRADAYSIRCIRE